MVPISFGVVVTLVVTVVVILALGAYSGRTINSADEFSLSGRSAGSVLIAGSISGTCVGGASTVGTAQMASALGLSAWWFTIGTGVGLIVLAVFFAYPLRRSGLETISQYLSLHYGRSAGTLTSLISSLGILFSAVASELAGIHLLSLLFGIPPWLSALLLVVLIVCYVVFGGMRGAGVSGLLKMAIIWVTLCVAGVTATLWLRQLPDFATLFPPFPWFSLFSRGVDGCVANLLSMIVGIVCSQSYVQAVYSASDTRVAAVGTIAAALITIPVGLPLISVGMFMHAQHPELPPVLALPVFFINYLPSWVAGMGLAGILLSVIGSASGLSLSIATMVANDYGRDRLKIDERYMLLLTRGAVLAVAGVSIGVALANLDSFLLDWNYMSMALRGAGVFLPMTLAIYWTGRLTAFWAVLSMTVSTALAVVVQWFHAVPINPLFVGLAVSAVLVVVGIAVTPARVVPAHFDPATKGLPPERGD
jgi:solute:Na+ symporter, SSS family